jgi:hypothetical protein
VQRVTENLRSIESFYGRLGRGAQKKQHKCYTASTRATVASEPFVNQMRRGNVHVNASRKTFNYIYARFQTFHRMGASQERAAFFSATLLVVTRHPGGPPGRPKIHPVLPRFALLFLFFFFCEIGYQGGLGEVASAAEIG